MESMKKPAIRFKGFTEDWEQRKLGEVFEEYSEKNHEELPALMIVQGGGTLCRDESERNLMYDKANLSNYKMVNEGDFIIHLRSFEGGLEMATNTGIISPAYHTLHGENTDSRFYYLYFRSKKFIDTDLRPHVYGIRDGRSIDIDGMKTINIPYTSFSEQKAIGDYISAFDHLITLHQRKYEKLQNMKKACLEKMFPKNGSDVPEIRFKGFTEAWEQRKVSELLTERDEKSPMSEEYPLMAFIANEGVAPKGERYDRSSLVTDTERKLYKKTEFGDFIYSSNNLETGSIGLNKYGNACISPVYSIFQPTGIADSDFLGRRLVRKDFINSMVKWRQGVIYGQWRIHESDFLKIKIPVPTVEEQRKIGCFLDQIDHLITLHQRELEKLQNIKKSMLEKMFVSEKKEK